jgi:hypothetical protein
MINSLEELKNHLHELDEFCNFILRELGGRKPQLSSEITKRLKKGPHAKSDPLLRKAEKIRLLRQLDGPFLEAAMQELNRSEHKGVRSPLNCIDLIERVLPSLNWKGEISGGNFRKL